MKSYLITDETINYIKTKFSDVEIIDDIITVINTKTIPIDVGQINYELRSRYVGGNKSHNPFLVQYHELHNSKK